MVTAAGEVLDVLRGDLDTPAQELQDIVDLVANICGAAWATISIVEGDEIHATITHGLDPLTCPVSETLCEHYLDVPGLAVVPDARAHEVHRSSPFVDGRRLNLRFYASAPIYAPSGGLVGRLCVFDPEPREPDDIQCRALDVLAASVTDVLRLQVREREPVGPPGASQLAEDEVARIAAEISHDMRVPLATIAGNVELMQDAVADLGNPAYAGMLDRTARATHRLTTMVQQLLDFHRAGTTTTPTCVDLHQVVVQLLEDLESELKAVGASVVLEPLPRVMGDRYELGSVMLNLLTNAIKFAKPDEPLRVRISATPHGRLERIRVRDNGVGIPQDLQSQVLHMFGRASTRVEGHGIGLATASRIVRAHGGEIGIESDGASGSEVWCDLVPAPQVPAQATRAD